MDINSISVWKYLGTTIVSQRGLSYSSEEDLKNFYRAANLVLNVVNAPNETIQMHLLHTNCAPILVYACGIKEYPSLEMTNCNTALNNKISNKKPNG